MSDAIIDFDEPLFQREQALRMIRADETTLDNWLRHKHVVPTGEKGRRLFSPNNLIQAELIFSLANTFKVPPAIGRVIADEAIAEYRVHANVDLLDVWGGANFASVPDGDAGRTQLSLVRDADGSLRAHQPNDRAEDQVTIVLPTRLIARSVFAKMKILMERATEKVPA